MPARAKTERRTAQEGGHMAEETQGANPTEQAEGAAAQPSEPEKDWKAEYEKAVAQSRKWEQRSKANADAAKKLAELEDSTKTDAERLAEAQKRADEAEAKVAEFERKAERAAIVAEVAASKGVDAEWLGRMSGDTREEVEANAAYIASKLSGSPIYPSVTDNGQKKTPTKKSTQDQFGDFLAAISN